MDVDTARRAVAIRQKVWDAPIRIFHWSLVVLLGFSWWSAKTYHMDWHQYSGLAVCALILFRLLWGLIGSSTARFAGFVRGPRAVWSYLRGRQGDAHGHNPLGGWSVLALLGVLSVQIVSGLFAVDVDGIESGPLSYMVTFDQGRWAAGIHGTSFNLLLVLSALHIAAILFYLLVKRRNLLWPMVIGTRPRTAGSEEAAFVSSPFWRLAAAAIAAGIFAYAIARGFRF